jgi:hypothetical protein
MAAPSWTVSAKAAGGFWTITVSPIGGGSPVYQVMYSASPPDGMTLQQYKAAVGAQVQAQVASIVAARANLSVVAGLDGQTF